MLGNGANGLHRSRILGIGGIFGNESAVGLHLGDAEQFGEVRGLAQRVDARRACSLRHQADGRGAAQEIPHKRLRANHFDGGGHQLIFVEQVAKLRGQLRREVADVAVQRQEAVGKAQVVDALEVLFRRAEGRNDQSQRHGLQGSCTGPGLAEPGKPCAKTAAEAAAINSLRSIK